jgi:protein-disulfide isomerase
LRAFLDDLKRSSHVKSNATVFLAVCVGAVLGFAVGQHMGAKGPLGTPIKQPVANSPAAAAGAEQIFKVAVGDAPVKGDADAKVTIVEWSDFQCPYCGRVVPTLEQIERAYGSDVRVAFKHNPLPMHPNAPYAAKAAIAAERQGKFWPMHDKLFEANNSHQPDALNADNVDRMARDLGLDMEKFKADTGSAETAQRIAADQAQGAKLGANGTPHFFINGARISGALPYESFKAVVDAQLRRANTVLAGGIPRRDLYENLIKDGITAPAPAPQQPAAPPPVTARNVDPGNGPAIGGKQPKVTIVEWSDFQCPFCGRVEPTLKQIMDTYKDDVKLVWRNEPLSFHPNAMPAAKAAMAASKQGKFWPMHDLMFSHQTELSEAKYEEWAKQIGLNVTKWKFDKDSPEVAELINKDNSYGQSVGADGTPSFFINGRFVSGAMPFDTFKSVIDDQIKKADEALKKGVKHDKLYETLVAENVKSAGSAPAMAAAQAPDQKFDVQVGNAPARGPKTAPVTIVEFSDFQCPFCGRVEPTIKQVEDAYKGKVRVVWKNQPLSFHPNAMPAAEAAMAAYEQGNDKFWAMHDKLFEQQAQLSPSLYEAAAKEIGLDMGKWKSAVEAHAQSAAIQADMNAGNAVGANGTPTFFINGKRLVGAMPFDSFKQVIDAELAAKVAKK